MQYRMNLVLVALAAVAVLVGTAGVAQADLIAHWAFDEGLLASTAVDSSGSPIQHNGVVDTSSAIKPTTGQPGHIGNAYLFTGSASTAGDGGVRVPAGTGGELDTFTVATLCAWVYMTDNNSFYDGIIVKYGTGRSYDLRGNTNVKWDSSFGGPSWRNQITAEDTNPLSGYVNNWHMLTSTYRYSGTPGTSGWPDAGGIAELYVDGQWVGADTDSNRDHSGIPAEVVDLYLGTFLWSYADYGSFPGYLDDLGIWSEALSAPKIAALANVVGFGTTPGVSGLEAYNQSYMKKLFDVYDAGSGSDTVGGLVWEYATGLTGGEGAAWAAGGSYYVQLDAAGNGVTATIPEPSTLLLLTTGLLGLLAYAWRKRK